MAGKLEGNLISDARIAFKESKVSKFGATAGPL